MTVEIELKFIATPEAIAALPAKVSSLKSRHSAPQQLTNIYYETAENTLREQDIGLRIRGFDGQYEMTVKTSGKAVGGLHQRPEYNVPLDEPVLDLARFPAEIWPEGCDVAALQGELQPLFKTDFMREKWVVTYQQSEIEIALDQGVVQAGELSEPLAEIELELKEGNVADLLHLAAWLGEEGGLRQGGFSKAARGFWLARGTGPRKMRPIPVWTPPAKATVEQGMAGVLEQALSHWQYHEELWLRGDKQARHAMIEALGMVRQALALFGGLVPRKATSELRNQFNALEPLLADPEVKAAALCFGADYLKCKLALTSYLANAEWQQFVDEKSRKKLDGSFKRFADIMLSRVAADIKEAFSQPLTDDGYRDQLPRLTRQIIALHLLAGAYPQSAWQSYIENWQALQQSIVQQQQAWLEAARKHAVQQPAFWLNGAPAKAD